jgi:two-component system, NarL family, nitrate/nitrite response regulator NarL
MDPTREVATMAQRSFDTAVIGPDAVLREGLAHILSANDFRVLASGPDADYSFVSVLPRNQSLLLIIEVGGDFDITIRQITTFKDHCPLGRVAVLTHQHRVPEILSAFRAGANAYFVNVATTAGFIKTLELVMLGETIVPPSMLTLSGDQEPCRQYVHCEEDDGGDEISDKSEGATSEELPQVGNSGGPRLSARQAVILRCLLRGDSNKTIARRVLITEATVKVHINAILRKINVRNRTQAAIWAVNNRRMLAAVEGSPPD